MFQYTLIHDERLILMVTIWDVAERAGVSKSTVSLVLNRSPLVKDETRKKVLDAIKALKYVPNYNARSLIMRKNNSIGVIHTLRSTRPLGEHYEWNYGLEQFSHNVEDGVFAAIMDLDTDISVIKEHFDLSTEKKEMPKILRNRRVDGAIFVGGFDNADVLDFMKSIDVPIVLVTSSLKIDGIDTVLHDPSTGSKLAMKKFIETGHKKICLVNCPQDYRVWPKRIEGVMAAAEECGYQVDPELLISPEKNTAQSAYEEFKKLLDKGICPDAVVTANNEMVMGVLRCLYEKKIRVPEDISVICYEDSNFCGNMTPALSAVNIQKEIIGRTALGFLLDRIENQDLPARSFTVEPFLVMRDSVIDRR